MDQGRELDNRIQAAGVGLATLQELWAGVVTGLRDESGRDHAAAEAVTAALAQANRALFVKQAERVAALLELEPAGLDRPLGSDCANNDSI